MQHSESTPDLATRPGRLAHPDRSSLVRAALGRLEGSALWYVLSLAVVGLLVALTYALAQTIVTSWVFVN